MNLTEALKFVEEHIPASVDHKIEAVTKVVEANKDEFARATAELSVLVSQSSTLSSYLDTLKTRVEIAEAQLATLKGNPQPAAATQPVATPPGNVTSKPAVTTTTN